MPCALPHSTISFFQSIRYSNTHNISQRILSKIAADYEKLSFQSTTLPCPTLA